MARGGARIGAGRKPRLSVVSSQSLPQPVDLEVASRLSEPPEGMPDAQQAVWTMYAPHGIEAGTLTERTAGAFGLLCKLIVMEGAVAEQIAADGWTYLKVTIDGAGQEHRELKPHPLCSHYRGLVQRIEAQMKNFALAPFGKPVIQRKKKGPVNPWAGVAQQ